MRKQSIVDNFNYYTTGFYLMIVGLGLYISTKIGKKIVDFVFDATIEKFVASIQLTVKPLLKDIEDDIDIIKDNQKVTKTNHDFVLKKISEVNHKIVNRDIAESTAFDLILEKLEGNKK